MLEMPAPLRTAAYAVAGLGLMLAFSPLADRLATRLVAAPPDLSAFRPLQKSAGRLLVGLLVAWGLGGFLEEWILRGFVVRRTELLLAGPLPAPLAAGLAILLAAFMAATVHLYQGRRGALIVGQLSVLFGVLYVVSGHDLWAVIICHGLYDTIAFVRFALGKSKYSRAA